MNFDNKVQKILNESDWHFSDTGNIRGVRYSDTERGREKGHDPEGERYDSRRTRIRIPKTIPTI
jgi:hypothetical protein